MKYTVGVHNMLFKLKDQKKWTEDLIKSGTAEIVGYQEAEGEGQGAALRRFCADTDRGIYYGGPEFDTGNPITWDRKFFRRLRSECGVVEVHKKHPTAKFNPARDFAYVGLHTLDGNFKVLVINVHPVSGAYKPEDLTQWGDDLDRWKDWAVKNYWLDVVCFLSEQMSREFWDDILLIGDFNSPLNPEFTTNEWYLPPRMLESLIRTDVNTRQIMHACITRDSDSSEGERTTKRGHTDHPIVFQEYTNND